MTEEIMPRENRMGKILTFIGGCLAGVIGVFTIAAMSEVTPRSEVLSDSLEIDDIDDDEYLISYKNSKCID
jgi:hypothetical protein